MSSMAAAAVRCQGAGPPASRRASAPKVGTVQAMPETTIRLGDTEVRRIGMGSNRLEETPRNVEFVRAAVDAGLTHIDTAFERLKLL